MEKPEKSEISIRRDFKKVKKENSDIDITFNEDSQVGYIEKKDHHGGFFSLYRKPTEEDEREETQKPKMKILDIFGFIKKLFM